MRRDPLTLTDIVERAIVSSEQGSIMGNMLILSKAQREAEGIGWGRTGLIDPSTYRALAESIASAIESEKLYLPHWTFCPDGLGTVGTIRTGNQELAERLALTHSRWSLLLHGCYCSSDHEGDPVTDDGPRPYRHFSEEWLKREIVAPAILRHFGGSGAPSTYALTLADSLVFAIGGFTPVIYEWTLTEDVTVRDAAEMFRIQQERGLTVKSHRMLTCRTLADARP